MINHIIWKAVHTAMKTSVRHENTEENICENVWAYLVQ